MAELLSLYVQIQPIQEELTMNNTYLAMKIRGTADQIIEAIQSLMQQYGEDSTVVNAYQEKYLDEIRAELGQEA